ncbi:MULTISPECIES: hypothetical protein [Sorangium]|uniref:Uncharacterized protein n=1 Tax=Sorangium cellulosum TaxID=56 RepID=A0A4P2QR62_SORCE|nr:MULTISPECIES: hypothetical protein [Sorangium]AUX32023.1 uncharacterized protein SOCE836_041590 [Sorangium cellulosum]WCQ91395.1 hypothetical protein NQZ70_04114 [Sorangium sp. Soce836]
MLKALLHGKLVRVAVRVDDEAGEDAQEDGDAQGVASDGLTELEDPLTSAVFERFEYLPAELAWNLLRGASRPLGDGATMPAAVPGGVPSWSFWPALRPGDGGRNKLRVEPDVLVSWGDTLLVIEAKHRGLQDPSQWVEQIRAARAAPAHAAKQLWLIAVGGIVTQEGDGCLAHVRRELAGDRCGLLTIRWEDLREALYAVEAVTPSVVLRDMAAALEAWGYRRKVRFSSLPAVAGRLRAEEAMAVLRAGRVG